MSRVMCRDAGAKHDLAVFVRFYFGICEQIFLENRAAFFLFFGIGFLRFVGGNFERGFIAAAARRHKNNRRQKIVAAQSRNQFRRRNFRQFEFHLKRILTQNANFSNFFQHERGIFRAETDAVAKCGFDFSFRATFGT